MLCLSTLVCLHHKIQVSTLCLVLFWGSNSTGTLLIIYNFVCYVTKCDLNLLIQFAQYVVTAQTICSTMQSECLSV